VKIRSALVDEHGWLKENSSADGIHPNAEGYKIMAPIAEAAILSAVSSKQSEAGS
jgi:acyl-CoA thioesterase-1